MRTFLLVLSTLVCACGASSLPMPGDDLARESDLGRVDLSSADDLAHAASAVVGAACADARACAGFACITDAPFTNGTCAAPAADCGAPTSAAACPIGTLCRQVDAASAATVYVANLCLKRCSSDDDCRQAEGYRCCPKRAAYAGPDGTACVPAPSGCVE